MIDWRPYFPLERPRAQQERALDELCSHIENGKRVLVGELGTGVGKSAVAVCLGRWLAAREPIPHEPYARGTVIITAQKSLQDQYVRDFPEARDLRSAQNFQCDRGGTCGEMSRTRKAVGKERAKQLSCPACPYRAAKEEFKAASLGISNYSFHLSELVYAGELPLRQLLVLDECHRAEDEVRRWSTVQVSQADAEERQLKLPNADDPAAAIEWLDKVYKPTVERRLGKISSKLLEQLDFSGVLGAAIHKLAEENDKLDKRKCQINRLVQYGGEVLVSSNEGKNGRSLTFQPFEVAGLANDLLYSKASACLMLSATILDKRTFYRHAGVPSDAPFVSIPTPFNPKAFGVKFRPVGRMSQATIEATLPKMVKAIRRVLKEHPEEAGIVHTHSYKVTRAIEMIKDPRLLIQKGSEDREGMLARHLSGKESTVLVSPAMSEGLDLRDDLGRFQVICKVPYPHLADPVVKKKPRDWYAWRTVLALVQAMGRGVRSDTDWTTTIILDECFMDILRFHSDLLPAHIKDGLELEEP